MKQFNYVDILDKRKSTRAMYAMKEGYYENVVIRR